MKPQPKNKEIKEHFMTIRLPLSVMEELKRQAEANTRTMSGQALLYIKQGLKK
jgi:hypothetical protein